MPDLTPQAIQAAISSDWEKAVDLNNQILCEDANNIDCLNRLGKAYLELGENKKAATIFRKVLKLNRYDQIAQRNLARATQPIGTKRTNTNGGQKTSMANFLEEPGRTKLIQLVNLASAKVLLKLDQADLVTLSTRRRTVVASGLDGNYVGSLPDDVGHRLAILMKGGNTYSAVVKAVTRNLLIIFVRETRRAKRFVNTPSFMNTNNDYFSFLREEALPTNPPVISDDDESEEPSEEENLKPDSSEDKEED